MARGSRVQLLDYLGHATAERAYCGEREEDQSDPSDRGLSDRPEILLEKGQLTAAWSIRLVGYEVCE